MSKEGKRDRSCCGTAVALEIVGDRWSLLIVRAYIFMGMREYGQFLTMPEVISTNVLADRLSWLVENKILIKHPHPTNGTKYFYEMTDKGFDLLLIIMEMARWSWKYNPEAFCPDDIKTSFLQSNPSTFIQEWKARAQQCSAEYIAVQRPQSRRKVNSHL